MLFALLDFGNHGTHAFSLVSMYFYPYHSILYPNIPFFQDSDTCDERGYLKPFEQKGMK